MKTSTMTKGLTYLVVKHPSCAIIRRVVVLLVSSLWIWLFVIAKRSTGDESDPVQGQIPTEIIKQVKATLDKVSPGGKVLEDEPGRFRFGDRMMTVKDHNTFPNGFMKEKS